MKQEYIVVNKTKLLERIGMLSKQTKEYREEGKYDIAIVRENMSSQLGAVISYSTPLKPIISDALQAGGKISCSNVNYNNTTEMYEVNEEAIKQEEIEYINNLKLDI